MSALQRRRLQCELLEDRRLLAGMGQSNMVDDSVLSGGVQDSSAAVHGVIWNDLNGNGLRENNEPGLSGVTIFSDLNGNGRLDGFEPWTVSRGDDSNTPNHEAGEYRLLGLPAGLHVIRQIVPQGMDQTYPHSAFPEPVPTVPITLPPDAHVVLLHAGQVVSGFDFGNQEYIAGAVSGVKWEDLDGDGQRDDDEPGLAGVWIYADIDRNGRWDRSEPWTRTVEDDPNTRADETGRYHLAGLRPGEYLLREIVPEGFHQTFPLPEGTNVGGPEPEPWRTVDPSFASVHPDSIDVQLAAGETYIATVSITVHVSFIQPIMINISASTPEVQFENLSGTQINGGSGQTSDFDVMITGNGTAQFFHILFFDGNPAALSPIYGAIPVAIRPPGSSGAHQVTVEPGQTVERVNFGNQRVSPGAVHGIKWLDRNGNGRQDEDETGLAGVVIYSDLNRNGALDDDEPSTRSMEDDPATDFDETGMYRLANLRPGRHVIREVVPEGYQQTYPGPGFVPLEPPDPDGSLRIAPPGAHEVFIVSGETVGDVDFGNQLLGPAAVSGRKWLDRDGDAQRDPDEPGLGGVTVYSDLNFNGRFDRDEPSTVTRHDDPVTDFDEGGLYVLDDLDPGFHWIREVVPAGSRQTYPNSPLTVIGADSHMVRLRAGEHLDGLDFGNQPLPGRGPLPADFNSDGVVDDRDRDLWRQTFGSTTNLAADANGDGVVNAADHVIWRNHHGKAAVTAASATPAPVPLSTPSLTLSSSEVEGSETSALVGTPWTLDLVHERRATGVAGSGSQQRPNMLSAPSDTQLRHLDGLRDRVRNALRHRDAAFASLIGRAPERDTDPGSSGPAATAWSVEWDSWD